MILPFNFDMSLDNSPQFGGQLIIEHPDLYAPITIRNKRDNTIDSYCLCKNTVFSFNVLPKIGDISIQRNRNVATPKQDTLISHTCGEHYFRTFRLNGDCSILCNRDITTRNFCTIGLNGDVSKSGNTVFPACEE